MTSKTFSRFFTAVMVAILPLSPVAAGFVGGCAPADSDPCGTFSDGDYVWGVWTCTSATGTIDVRAYAESIGIESVEQTVAGTEGAVDVSYSGGAA